MLTIRTQIQRLARVDVPVLLEGENGTGKDLFAHYIHRASPWAAGPFLKVSCPAIPSTLLESELFGYQKGAFTGALQDKRGRIESAQGGTLFLDEIADLDSNAQSKLLQVLQDGRFTRIGAEENTQVTLRLICSTNRVLDDDVASGALRRDLYYRINVVHLRIPPLRERLSDLEMLTTYFWQMYTDKYSSSVPKLSPDTLARMARHSWPGNIRELANFVRRLVIDGSEQALLSELNTELDKQHKIGEYEIPLDGPISLKKLTKQAVRHFEGRVMLKILESNGWNRKAAAKTLKISYRAFLYKLRDAGIVCPSPDGRSKRNLKAKSITVSAD